MADFLDETRKQITDRLRELKPTVDEYDRLKAAASALTSVGGSAAASVTPKRRGPGRPRGSGTRAKTRATVTKAKRKKPGRPPGRPRAGRPKGTGTRAAQALSFIQGQPGITIPELAVKMSISPNYLYRVMPSLEKGGRVKKKGRGWHAQG